MTSTPLLVGVISHQHNIISRPPVDTNPDILLDEVIDKTSFLTNRVMFKSFSAGNDIVHSSRVKNSGFVNNLWITKFDGLILYFGYYKQNELPRRF